MLANLANFVNIHVCASGLTRIRPDYNVGIGDYAGSPGFEPGRKVLETLMLPLHHEPLCLRNRPRLQHRGVGDLCSTIKLWSAGRTLYMTPLTLSK